MIGGMKYTGRARFYYALYRACEWLADRFRDAEEFFILRANRILFTPRKQPAPVDSS